jgi:uncharacterized protein
MHQETIALMPSAPGGHRHLSVLRFGSPDARPKATLQAALHADEIPPMLVAWHLRSLLTELETAGQIRGCVQLLPYANPLGLDQQLLGQHEGRFDLSDGVNFNRLHPDLGATVMARLAGRIGGDAERDVPMVRAALRQAAAELEPKHPAQHLKNQLVQLAIDSDVVLDLHCDSEAAMHVYALTPQRALAEELGALLGAQAVLLAEESGDSPFDEACSRPWNLLRQQHPGLPLACFSSTVELRGQADVSHQLARRDALALIEFLRRRGVIHGTPAALPEPKCAATPLAGSEPIVAPHAGVLVFHHEPGTWLEAGSVVADLIDPETAQLTSLRCQSAGRLYARIATRWATPGKRIAKLAGTKISRTGKLLSP